MKGLQERTGGNAIFLVVKHHGIVQESKHEREGFEPVDITLRSGIVITKYIKRYSGVEAMVKKIERYDREYDGRPYKGWKIYLDANGTDCVLDIDSKSRQAGRFLKLAENLDFSKPVEFSAWHDTEKDTTAFNVKQEGKSVPQRYTKDNPGDCPPPKERLGGELDFGDQEDFLFTRMMTVVIPKLEAFRGMATNSNGHHEPDNEDDIATSEPSAPLPSRDDLIGEISSLCKQLNDAGDDPKWTSGPKGTLAGFAHAKYGIEGGLPSLSQQQLFEIQTFLAKRLAEMDDEIPF